jgi:peptidoglycan/LPS O-acetylase OafA/YrhL
MSVERVYGFDLLRGICAVAVAYYHILGWLGMTHLKLYNLGLYGVYIFFVLSGSSIYIAYVQKFLNGYDFRKFLGLRLFRLVPLFMIVVLIGPLIDYGNFERYDAVFFQKAFLNITFAFSMGNPGEISLATGGWSLGVEFLFYLLFPAIISFVAVSMTSGLALYLSLFVFQLVYVHYQVVGPEGFSSWSDYVQFSSFASYFVAGCIIGRGLLKSDFLNSRAVNLIAWASFFLLLAAIYYSNGPSVELSLTGLRGLILPLTCVALAWVAGFLVFCGWAKKLANYLGNTSYGMYLLHPLVFVIFNKNSTEIMGRHAILFATVIIFTTSILAFAVERFFERPINKYGKKLLKGDLAAL